eukprot:7114451-Prymnesium_polylepis.1
MMVESNGNRIQWQSNPMAIESNGSRMQWQSNAMAIECNGNRMQWGNGQGSERRSLDSTRRVNAAHWIPRGV